MNLSELLKVVRPDTARRAFWPMHTRQISQFAQDVGATTSYIICASGGRSTGMAVLASLARRPSGILRAVRTQEALDLRGYADEVPACGGGAMIALLLGVGAGDPRQETGIWRKLRAPEDSCQ